MTTFRFRPHHLICSLCFQGKGYNEEFVHNFESIHKEINHPDTIIKIVDCCDDICTKCPSKLGNLCHHESEVTKIDKAYLNSLQLNIDQTTTVASLKDKIKELLTLNEFQNACGECSWYKLNICEPIIRDLIQNQQQK